MRLCTVPRRRGGLPSPSPVQPSVQVPGPGAPAVPAGTTTRALTEPPPALTAFDSHLGPSPDTWVIVGSLDTLAARGRHG